MPVKVLCDGVVMNARFVASTEGRNRLGMKELCQKFLDELQMPTCLTKDEAAQYVLDLFKRSVASELEMLDVKCVEIAPPESKNDDAQSARGPSNRKAR